MRPRYDGKLAFTGVNSTSTGRRRSMTSVSVRRPAGVYARGNIRCRDRDPWDQSARAASGVRLVGWKPGGVACGAHASK